MSLKKLIFFHLNALILIFGAKGQGLDIPVGDWRVHLPYQTILSVEAAGDKVYASSTVNAFYYNYSDNTLNILSKVNGLNDVNISVIRYHQELGIVVIGYSNGNIDVIKDEKMINVNDIKRKSIVGSKKINDITFLGNYAYLCCDFGVCVYDLKRMEVKESYESLTSSSTSVKVYGCTFNARQDSIFLATDKGVMVGKNSPTINLMDYKNWYTYGSGQGLPSDIVSVVYFNDTTLAATKTHGIYYLSGGSWTSSTLPVDSPFYSIRASQNKLLINAGERTLVATTQNNFTFYNSNMIGNPNVSVLDNKGNLWIGDYWSGLFTNKGSNNLYSFKPNGPNSEVTFDLFYANNHIYASMGGYKFNGYIGLTRGAQFYDFDNYAWTTYNTYDTGFPLCKDILKGSYNPKDNKLYFASYGYGVLVANPGHTYELLDNTSGPFLSSSLLFITDVKVDKAGNVWVTDGYATAPSAPTLYSRNKNGAWTTPKAFNTSNNAGQYPLEILIDNNNYKWLRLRGDKGGGMIVYDDIKNKYLNLTTESGTGGLPDNTVLAFASDLNGDVWVATAKGIAIYYNTNKIFTSPSVDASIPYFDGFPLLYNESITCIKVDGGNRKWIGTKNGLWLLNDDGTEVINYFTQLNSPLLSNYILDVEINDLTGEVFIATDQGIISYRGTATAGKKEFGDVKVFPNPVPPNFNGLASISGLVTDADVKITDIYGTLIYQTKAEGGTAVWNGKNYNNRRAEPGVYLIFSASSDGTEKCVAKIAVE